MYRYATVVATVLAVSAASAPLFGGVSAPTQTSSRVEKTATVQRYVDRATDCVIDAIKSDRIASSETSVGELIVAVMPACVERMQAMIHTFDDVYGAGAGERFFSGAFLDLLPIVVSKRIGRDVGQK